MNATLIVHAEHPAILEAAGAAVAEELAAGRREPRAYTTWLDSRPSKAEERAIAALIAAVYQAEAAVSQPGADAVPPPATQEPELGAPVPDPAVPDSVLLGGTGGGVAAGAGPPAPGGRGSVPPGRPGRAHVLHLSAASAGALVAAAKADGVAITAETCPHYLTIAAEDVPDGATDHKCAPPIRDRANQDRLWQLLADGTIDAIVSDHSPCPPEDKRLDDGDFEAAWGGISSLQLGLPLVWTEARNRGFGLDDVVGWMAASPARIAGLERKGAIVAGADADLVVFDPDATWTVEAARLHHRHPVTPYHGRELRGAVRRTYLGGRLIARDGEVVGPPRGQLRRRGGAR